MIRNATLEDMPRILELAREMHLESRFAQYEFSDFRLQHTMTDIINSETGIAIVFEQDGEIIGGIAAYVFAQYFGYTLAAQDLVFFITKEARGGSAYLKIMKEYIKQAKEKGAEDILIGVSAGIKTEKIDALYKRMGFTEIGHIYKYEQ